MGAKIASAYKPTSLCSYGIETTNLLRHCTGDVDEGYWFSSFELCENICLDSPFVCRGLMSDTTKDYCIWM